MYCPLCKAEYRDGFDQCSDCLARLVTREKADTATVVLSVEGTNVAKFDDIVGSLREVGIPNHSRSGVNSDQPSFGISCEWKEQMSWEVSVLESDYAKAREIIVV
jgi:hypothetical protein